MLDYLTGREFTDARTVRVDLIDAENVLAPRSAQ
jgi:hypothetical protein